MRSTVDVVDGWVVDLDATKGAITDTRRLDRYCFEQLVPLPGRTNLLMQFNVSDDLKLLKGKGERVHCSQKTPTRIIGGKELKCTIDDLGHNELAANEAIQGDY